MTKDEVVEQLKREICSRQSVSSQLDRLIALCRAPLVAEVERLRNELSTTDVLLEECKMDWSGDVTQIKAEHKREVDTLRAQLAALQSQDELPEPVIIDRHIPTNIVIRGYTADQLRQAQAKVRAKMVPLEKDAARYLRLRDYLISDRVDCDDAIVDALTTEELDAAVDALPDGITGEPK